VQAYDLPAAGGAGDADLRVRAGGAALALRMEEQIPYSTHRARSDTDHDDISEVSRRAIEFVDTLVSTMLELRLSAEYFAGRIDAEFVKPVSEWLKPSPDEFEPSGPLPLARLPWPAVGKCLLDKRDQPRMDVIVRIAGEFEKPLARLAEAPRRILRRERSMTALSRVQETDDACLEWLVRQPGRTPAEKAGPRQQILAVVRFESCDTLENRVLKDFLQRCIEVADQYIDESTKYRDTKRPDRVAGLRNTCRRLLELPHWTEVSGVHSMPQPNYVLQHDRSYRELWKWYLRLVHRERQIDKAWRWQRRLWADMVRLGVGAAIYKLGEEEQDKPGAAPEFEVRAPYEHSVWLGAEQDCGTWAARVDWPGPIVLSHQGNADVIVECVHPLEPRVATYHRREALPKWCGALGADLALLFCPIGGHGIGRDVCLFVWAIHCAAEAPDDSRIKVQTKDACDALNRLWQEAGDDNIAFRGIILRSRLDGECKDMDAAKGDDIEVAGLGLPADPAQWQSKFIDLLRTQIGICAYACFD